MPKEIPTLHFIPVFLFHYKMTNYSNCIYQASAFYNLFSLQNVLINLIWIYQASKKPPDNGWVIDTFITDERSLSKGSFKRLASRSLEQFITKGISTKKLGPGHISSIYFSLWVSHKERIGRQDLFRKITRKGFYNVARPLDGSLIN